MIESGYMIAWAVGQIGIPVGFALAWGTWMGIDWAIYEIKWRIKKYGIF
jgi:hypothetical protein